MKNKLFIIFMFLLMAPILVFADSGIPSRPVMKAKIINTEGAIIYSYDNGKYIPNNKTLAFDSIVTISNEYRDYAVYYDEKTDEENYISLKDIKYIWDISQYNLVDAGFAMMVDDTIIYDNPSMSGKILGTIEKGIEIKIKVAYSEIENVNINIFYDWAYVEYNNVKGWIYVSTDDSLNYWDDDQSKHGTVAESTDVKIMTIRVDTNIYGDVFKLNKIGYLGEKEEYITKYYYYNRTTEKHYYYVKTSQGSGWICSNDLVTQYTSDEYVLVLNDQIKIYAIPNRYSPTDFIEAPIGSIYKISYIYYDENDGYYYYVKINDKSYWVKEEKDYILTFRHSDTIEYELDSNVNYYSKAIKDKDNLLGYLKPGIYNSLFIKFDEGNDLEYIYYVLDKGFIFTEDEFDPSAFYTYTHHKTRFLTDIITYSDENLELENNSFQANKDYDLEIAFVRKDYNNENIYYAKDIGYFALKMDISDLEIVEQSKVLKKDTNNAVYYIIGSAVLSLTILGIIILIVKKKKSKENNSEQNIVQNLEMNNNEQNKLENQSQVEEIINQQNKDI